GLLDASAPPRQVLTGQLLPGTHLPQVRGKGGEERFDRHVLQAIPAIPVVAVEGRACGHDRAHHYPPPFALPRGRSRPSVVVSGGLLRPTDTTTLSRHPDNRQSTQQLWITTNRRNGRGTESVGMRAPNAFFPPQRKVIHNMQILKPRDP